MFILPPAVSVTAIMDLLGYPVMGDLGKYLWGVDSHGNCPTVLPIHQLNRFGSVKHPISPFWSKIITSTRNKGKFLESDPWNLRWNASWHQNASVLVGTPMGTPIKIQAIYRKYWKSQYGEMHLYTKFLYRLAGLVSVGFVAPTPFPDFDFWHELFHDGGNTYCSKGSRIWTP